MRETERRKIAERRHNEREVWREKKAHSGAFFLLNLTQGSGVQGLPLFSF